MKPRYWFLTNRFAHGACASCTALATGWDSRGVLRCCGECGFGDRAGPANRQRCLACIGCGSVGVLNRACGVNCSDCGGSGFRPNLAPVEAPVGTRVCNCAFRQAQRRIAREIPVEYETRRARA